MVLLGAAFFSCLSMSIAGIVLKRERLMGIGQAIMMPLFFASNALYPVALMPAWVRAISHVNPLSYEVDALRGLLLGTPAHIVARLRACWRSRRWSGSASPRPARPARPLMPRVTNGRSVVVRRGPVDGRGRGGRGTRSTVAM